MTTSKLKLPELTASQSQKHVTHNEALFFLDNLVQLAVIDKDLSTPPGSPTQGATYIVGDVLLGLACREFGQLELGSCHRVMVSSAALPRPTAVLI